VLPAYISIEQYERNMQRLDANRSRAQSLGAVRDGPALLAGLVVCGRCGHKMSVRYQRGSGWNAPQHGDLGGGGAGPARRRPPRPGRVPGRKPCPFVRCRKPSRISTLVVLPAPFGLFVQLAQKFLSVCIEAACGQVRWKRRFGT
jgi:recombinase-like zinc beta ribbon protein